MFYSDVSWPLLQKIFEECDLSALKPLKVQTLISDNKVKIQGYDKTFEVENGLGQGNVMAARLASMGSAEC